MNALQEQFVAEARELIHQATDDLIATERRGSSAERIDRVFRAFHTLKGSAGVVELPAMSLTLHAAEDLLTAVAAGKVRSSPTVINEMLACLDHVSAWVNHFEIHQTQPTRAGEDARTMADALRNLIAASAQVGPAHTTPTSIAAAVPSWVDRLIESKTERRAAGGLQQAVLFAISYEPVAGCFFNGDDPLELMRRVPQLLSLHVEPRETWQPLGKLDPFSCNLRLKAISAARQSELAALFRLVPDQVRIVEIPAAAWQSSDKIAHGGAVAALVRAVLEEQRQVLRAVEEDDDNAGRIGSASRVAANALRHVKREDWAERVEQAGAAALSQSNRTLLQSVLEEASSALAHGEVEDPSPADREIAGRASRLLRVDESKIDALLDLAAELIVVKNGFAHLAKRVDGERGEQEVARMVRSQHDVIDRLASELHSAILQLRMVPIAQVFRSFSRLVRDMAQRLNKDVRLVTQGETIESDKTIVDLLFEPLLHLVRNALDHGIETPEQRLTAGKSETASITLAASRTGDRFVVDVIDDGRGIDPNAIRRKAGENALLSKNELTVLSDQEVIELIFSSGFSTASEISDISGRGVGMDVVRSSIERIGGRVSLKSRVGFGTTVSLNLPMNIAMSRIMVVEAGGQSFGIPMDAVTETLRLSPDQISRIKDNEGFVLHDRVVPICSLAELMKLPSNKASEERMRLIVVAESGGRVIALEIDAIRERMEVVLKPMQGLLSNARGYAGTTLMGDGAVLLVLDMKEIMP
jgi:two-component system, chemotaxis family, sensor kinase CheA